MNPSTYHIQGNIRKHHSHMGILGLFVPPCTLGSVFAGVDEFSDYAVIYKNGIFNVDHIENGYFDKKIYCHKNHNQHNDYHYNEILHREHCNEG